MKRIAVGTMLVAILLNMAIAQEQLPTEKKVTFGQDGKMYVHKELGIYIWLSTSPDENSKKHRLLSDSSKRFTNPMYFDTEGYNTLRSPSAVDTNTKTTVFPLRDIIFEVYADGEAPVTTNKFLTGTSLRRKGKLYYGGEDISFNISAYDKVSGVDKTYYSLNGADFKESKDTMKLSEEGETSIKYYSTDKVGNREEVKEKVIYIDNSAPKTNYEIDGLQNEKFVSAKASIKLESEDKTIGVKAIYYKINNGPRRIYTSPIPVSLLGADGSMSFYAIDFLNNKEELQVIGGKGNEASVDEGEDSGTVFEFYVDNSPPTVNVDFDGAFSKGQYKYVSTSTKLKVKADDDKSGVEKVLYSVNNKNLNQTYEDGIEFDKEGVAYIRIKAVDYVGNKSATVTNAYFVDASAPKTKITVNSPKHRVKDTLFITSNTKLSLSAKDNASGVSKTLYSIESGDETEYAGPFTVSGKGNTIINYKSVDNVNNIEATNKLSVFVDDIPPIIYHHFSTTPIGSKNVREEELTIYPSNVKLYIAATDEESGGEKIEYSINGGSVRTTNPIKGLTPGNYEVVVTAYDVLGNSSKETIKFSVEN